jgi:hypothetical protein
MKVFFFYLLVFLCSSDSIVNGEYMGVPNWYKEHCMGVLADILLFRFVFPWVNFQEFKFLYPWK